MWRIKILGLTLLVTLAGLAITLPQNKSKIDQTRIDAAVEKGVNYLLEQAKKGLPPFLPFRYDDLVLYTLYHCGVTRQDPTFHKLLAGVLSTICEKT